MDIVSKANIEYDFQHSNAYNFHTKNEINNNNNYFNKISIVHLYLREIDR